ncbi:hypothetical protein RCE45_00290 [Klebsiella pneumoniae]|uniref:hypothetical protein n=1 Tax=Klebsiella pneumoniae TaxID=573 RepID=UPI0011132440|nr:hypothetical protein [Klebsiella pneumoniae]MDO0832613.1 hypothetical protein [Klebsiella pneumoniae]MDQ5493831.1 hypothetical protein [Klebsiella pneumoniae]MDQ5531417.1 hypothetical protein [Klebsiella pneumoniae]MDQ5558409.1 hypothetical protein [Klebsiella pneumoniae]MDQ5565849.1 hypothetical protein [Klebsiella pneumoniae]
MNFGEKQLTERNPSLTPQHMTATSTILTPGKDEVVITFYSHEFTYLLPENVQPQTGIQVKVDLRPEIGISLTTDQAIALTKALKTNLEANGLWKQ